MVISWLLNGICIEISESVVHMKIACDILQELEERFDQLNRP